MKVPGNRAVFLDRDGVLNRVVVRDGKWTSPRSLAELEVPEGTREALARLKNAGFLLVVATNQPEVPRGLVTRETVEQIHGALAQELPIDGFVVCYHDTADACPCRKPQPGLLLEAAGKWGIDPGSSYMVGDRRKDLEAGHRAGCKSVLIRAEYNRDDEAAADFVADDLGSAATWILTHLGRTNKSC